MDCRAFLNLSGIWVSPYLWWRNDHPYKLVLVTILLLWRNTRSKITLTKKIHWGLFFLIVSFRVLVHCHQFREHGGMQAGFGAVSKNNILICRQRERDPKDHTQWHSSFNKVKPTPTRPCPLILSNTAISWRLSIQLSEPMEAIQTTTQMKEHDCLEISLKNTLFTGGLSFTVYPIIHLRDNETTIIARMIKDSVILSSEERLPCWNCFCGCPALIRDQPYMNVSIRIIRAMQLFLFISFWLGLSLFRCHGIVWLPCELWKMAIYP